jgi:hypothetical protein
MIDYVGSSNSVTQYTPGSIITITSLLPLTYAIQDAYSRGYVNAVITAGSFVSTRTYIINSVGTTTNWNAIGYSGTPVVGGIFTATGVGSGNGTAVEDTYNNLISIGLTSIPGMGNSPPTTFNWTGYPNWASNYNYTNSVTQWGYTRLFALQAYNEFNYNGGYALGQYKDFLSGFMSNYSFIEYSNDAILSVNNSQTFLDGTYSNMDDLITGDITGVSIATTIFGQDLITSGKAISLQSIATFGLPSNLLMTLQKNNAITKSVSLALIASGITVSELSTIISLAEPISKEQERKIYGAFGIILGQDLKDVLVSLNCKTAGLESLADLLNPIKLFPNSYQTLTVPVYNTVGGPANSKIYYPIYVNDGLNSQLRSPTTVQQNGVA